MTPGNSWVPLYRVIPSTLGDERPTAWTIVEVAPGVYEYEYVDLIRGTVRGALPGEVEASGVTVTRDSKPR